MSPVVVYPDLLFAVNLVLDGALLCATARWIGRASWPRLAAAAVLGGAYGWVPLWPGGAWLAGLGGKILASVALLGVAFAPLPRAQWWRALGVFYALAFALAGVTEGIMGLTAAPGQPGLAAPIALPVAAAAVFAGAEAARRALGSRRVPRRILALRVGLEGREAEMLALVDTGNELHDPLNRAPVVVAELGAVQSLLPEPLRAYIQEAAGAAAPGDPARLPGRWAARVRFIPFRSVGSGAGWMIGFVPDRLQVAGEELSRPAVIAVTVQPLSAARAYRALLPPALCPAEASPDPTARRDVRCSAIGY